MNDCNGFTDYAIDAAQQCECDWRAARCFLLDRSRCHCNHSRHVQAPARFVLVQECPAVGQRARARCSPNRIHTLASTTSLRLTSCLSCRRSLLFQSLGSFLSGSSLLQIGRGLARSAARFFLGAAALRVAPSWSGVAFELRTAAQACKTFRRRRRVHSPCLKMVRLISVRRILCEQAVRRSSDSRNISGLALYNNSGLTDNFHDPNSPS